MYKIGQESDTLFFVRIGIVVKHFPENLINILCVGSEYQKNFREVDDSCDF